MQILDDRCKASPLAVKRSLKKKLGALNQTNRSDVVYWRKDAGCNGHGGKCGTARERARMRLAQFYNHYAAIASGRGANNWGILNVGHCISLIL